MAILRHQQVDCRSAPSWLQGLFPSSPTCVAGTSGALVLRCGVGSCSGTMGGGLQNAPEGSFRTCGPAGLGFYSLLFLTEKVMGGGG